MNAAAAYIANANHAARDWARAQAARTMARAALNSDGVVYRRTWPCLDAADTADSAKRAGDGWNDSTLDLRQGLSVVEVFDTTDDTAALQEFALLRSR
jgi:hypothetical protein